MSMLGIPQTFNVPPGKPVHRLLIPVFGLDILRCNDFSEAPDRPADFVVMTPDSPVSRLIDACREDAEMPGGEDRGNYSAVRFLDGFKVWRGQK